ncbi:MAG TPA: NCS2 family permease, partial [Longimicrobiales bacterium]|nr:NCS2 family permease [Longimicrobiales bacterium]
MNRWFEITERGSTPGRELRGAVATFLTMSYILFANPSILAAAGVPFQAAASGTALAAGLCSILMGLIANFPVALASGMGLNAVIAYQVAPALGSWQAAMVLVVLDGLIVLVLVLVGLREAIMHAIPRDLRRAIGVGIGLFIAFIGAVNARIIVVPAGTIQALTRDRTAILPPVTHGVLDSAEPLIALTGLLVIAVLMVKRVTGAILIGIVASTLLALLMGVTEPPSAVLAWPRFDTIVSPGSWFVPGLAAIPVLLSLVMVDFFDTIGTVTAIAEEARLSDDRGRPPRLSRILTVDAASASIGGLLGVSSVTSYIESAAGVAEGARTGLHSVIVGVLFLLAILIAPLLSIVPSAATAPALIVVGFLMCQQITRIEFRELDTAIPAFVLLITIPFTYSISHGIGLGFISYVVIKLLTGHARDVHPLMLGTAAAF